MTQQRDSYEIFEGFSRIDFDQVHSWLSGTYWSPNIPMEKVVSAAKGSALVVSVFSESKQVAYMRVVSDCTTFAWVCDVFVDESHRGRGLASQMVRYAKDHHTLQGLRRWLLVTRDAHPVYLACGFEVLENPENWMSYRPNGTPGPI